MSLFSVISILVMLSTLFPPDPTLTVGNVSRVMEKVKPKEREPLLKKMIVDVMFDDIQSSGKYPTASEVEAAAVDIYVNCDPEASWENLARLLYRCHQVAAVEEVRSYLPPRGEPGCRDSTAGVYRCHVLHTCMHVVTTSTKCW